MTQDNRPAQPGAISQVQLRPQTGLQASTRRILAQILRHWYLLRSSLPRVIEAMYWPLVQMLMWGFLQTWLAQNSSLFANAAGLLISALLLWDVLVRGQLGMSMSFLEEMWSRNLGHLLMSPLRPGELLLSLMLFSLIRLLVALVPVVALAWLIFDYNIFSLGVALIPFVLSLMLTSWALGLFTIGFVLRHGLGAEGMAWSVVFVLLPISCVYYPLAVLPGWLQPVSLALPPTYVFEGMRSILLHGVVRYDLMAAGFGLNALWLAAGWLLFRYYLNNAREQGTLLQIGE